MEVRSDGDSVMSELSDTIVKLLVLFSLLAVPIIISW